jgi:protein-disulfide isomerase
MFTAYSPYVNFLILPLFALANAGVTLDGATLVAAATSPLTWGIVVGLVVGKFVGISGATAALRATRLGSLAPGLTPARISGAAALSGIGFTIALFIVDLAIPDARGQAVARIGVLAASVIAFAAGAVIFRVADRVHPPSQAALYLIRPVDPSRDHLRGAPTAALSVVEYGDFECPFTLRATGAVDEVIDRLGVDVVYVYRHFPITRHHTWAMTAACASEAAALQGRFLEFGRMLFDNQTRLEDEHLIEYAVAVGLDVVRFDEDRRSGPVIARVQDDIIDADAMDIHETPTFFLNGRRHVGPWDAMTIVRELRTAASATDG